MCFHYSGTQKLCWLVAFLAAIILSGIEPLERFTWFLEVAPAAMGLGVIVAIYPRFQLSPLAYLLTLIHAIILCVGAHYTYAEVPLFDWLSAQFDWSRNNYDKLGHFAQGFVPAILAREVIIRQKIINHRAWMNFFVVCFCLAFSAFYELLEMFVAITTEDGSESFLGTQGYVWDTQTDMLLALIGASIAILTLSRRHDRQLKQAGYAPIKT